MRPCRIILVSPPETNRNCQFIEISTECNCNRNKNSLTYIQETLNLNCVMKEYHVRCQIRKFRDAVKCCQLFNFFKNHFCEHYFYDQWRLTSNWFNDILKYNFIIGTFNTWASRFMSSLQNFKVWNIMDSMITHIMFIFRFRFDIP